MYKIGDLVTCLYEAPQNYIVIAQLRERTKYWGEYTYELLCLNDGAVRVASYSEIKTINKADTCH